MGKRSRKHQSNWNRVSAQYSSSSSSSASASLLSPLAGASASSLSNEPGPTPSVHDLLNRTRRSQPRAVAAETGLSSAFVHYNEHLQNMERNLVRHMSRLNVAGPAPPLGWVQGGHAQTRQVQQNWMALHVDATPPSDSELHVAPSLQSLCVAVIGKHIRHYARPAQKLLFSSLLFFEKEQIMKHCRDLTVTQLELFKDPLMRSCSLTGSSKIGLKDLCELLAPHVRRRIWSSDSSGLADDENIHTLFLGRASVADHCQETVLRAIAAGSDSEHLSPSTDEHEALRCDDDPVDDWEDLCESDDEAIGNSSTSQPLSPEAEPRLPSPTLPAAPGPWTGYIRLVSLDLSYSTNLPGIQLAHILCLSCPLLTALDLSGVLGFAEGPRALQMLSIHLINLRFLGLSSTPWLETTHLLDVHWDRYWRYLQTLAVVGCPSVDPESLTRSLRDLGRHIAVRGSSRP
ncbi:uncharacterized protein BJ171DRAFT_503087 [Polychytrium aggregatum]|uniref:uncharacterized protein n=1 Tax=Polychytrium aggregatum TaxID=110093 RepID=UPI0022FEB9C7|nr:uncharacterized protein BJ171DRAFT_503087 [Polychytrium aggregatum]KAI9205135.1 hypothetical protein BJ171DRAFT_503087 [Polychytrium aggregatum]